MNRPCQVPQCHGSTGTHFSQTFLSEVSKGSGNNHSCFADHPKLKPVWCGPEMGAGHDEGVGSTCLQWSALVGTFGTGYTKWIRWHWQYQLLEMVTLSRSGDTGSMNFCNWLHTLSGSADAASMNFWNWLQKRLAAWTFAMLIKWTVFLNKSRSERGTTLMMDSRFAPWDVWQRCPHVMSI